MTSRLDPEEHDRVDVVSPEMLHGSPKHTKSRCTSLVGLASLPQLVHEVGMPLSFWASTRLDTRLPILAGYNPV
jgi:hypothetical protein